MHAAAHRKRLFSPHALVFAVAVGWAFALMALAAATARFVFWAIWTPAEFLADCALYFTREREN